MVREVRCRGVKLMLLWWLVSRIGVGWVANWWGELGIIPIMELCIGLTNWLICGHRMRGWL